MIGNEGRNDQLWHNEIYSFYKFSSLGNKRTNMHDHFSTQICRNILYGKKNRNRNLLL